MRDKNIFDRYLLALRKTPIDDKTEHTDRPALQNLLQAIADICGRSDGPPRDKAKKNQGQDKWK